MTYPNTERFAAMLAGGAPKIYVETGTWKGQSLERVKTLFETRYSIEIDPRIWRVAYDRFAGDHAAVLLLGDSRDVLPLLCRYLDAPVFFWLDGHYCGPEGGGSNEDMPLYEEMEAVLARNNRKDIIAIDDLGQMGKTGRSGVVDWTHISADTVIGRLEKAGCEVTLHGNYRKNPPQPSYLVARWAD